ncbi:hypothetical protein [Streptomyces europaeiscabiei]|uniref:hypothetical protein n=1 Tax=Streptomyces europaeiscabiei TaxID=146819 RepID=UPI002E182243
MRFATDDIRSRYFKARATIGSAGRWASGEEVVAAARAEMAACRIENTIRQEAGHLDEERLNKLADLMFEVEPE